MHPFSVFGSKLVYGPQSLCILHSELKFTAIALDEECAFVHINIARLFQCI